MDIVNLSDFLKGRFAGIPVQMDFGGSPIPIVDGQEFFNTYHLIVEFRNVECRVLDITYENERPSTLPSEITRKDWIQSNCRTVPDKKTYMVKFAYTETTVIGKSVTLTEGRSVTLKADAGFKLGIVSASGGVSETTTLNLTQVDTSSVTKTSNQSEDVELTYEIPPLTGIEVTLTKELKRYEMGFTGTFLLDGDVVVTATDRNGQLTGKYASAGRIIQYLSDAQRLMSAKGFINNIRGEITKKVVKDFLVADRPEVCKAENQKYMAKFFAPNIAVATTSSKISLKTVSGSSGGYFEATFDIETGACTSSSCPFFEVTLVYDDGSTMAVHIEGWSAGESSSSFQIVRNGSAGGGTIVNITDVEQADFICFDA